MRLALLGDPVGHSRSPAIHEAALSAAGIEGSYRAMRVDAGGLIDACRDLRQGELDGANVTMPWKPRALAECDEASPEARRIGAVNTIVATGGTLYGHTTDVVGLTEILRRFDAGLAVTVLGSGATAAAALVACEGRECAVVARRPEAGRALVQRVGVDAAVRPWDSPIPGRVLINATPIGMDGDALPPDWVDRCAGLIDLPYGDGDTPAVARARRRGIDVVDGIDALVAQAAASFTLWTGVAPPAGVMDRAARS